MDKSITSVGILFDYVQEADISDIEVVLSAASAVGLEGELNLDTVPVEGAKELIDKIARIEIVIDGDVKEGDNITYSDIATSIHYYDANENEIMSKGGVSIDIEKLKGLSETETLSVKIVEKEPSDTDESAESGESGESAESESAETAE